MANSVNRFYNPQRGQYQSQFIGEKLPLDLMLRGAVGKQGKYDELAGRVGGINLDDLNALPGDDTKYKQELLGKIDTFRDQMLQKDLSSPQAQQEYMNFARDIRDDQGRKAIGSAYQTHQEYLKRKKELETGKPTAYAKQFVYDYERNYGDYTKPGSGGFRSKSLDNPNILEGTDIKDEGKKFFDDLKASGFESTAQLGGQDIYYKTGWSGVSDARLKKEVERGFDLFYKSRAGDQLGREFDMNNEVLQSDRNKLGKDYEEKRQEYVKKHLLDMRSEFEYGKSESDLASAKNKAADLEREAVKETGIVDPLTLQTPTTTGTKESYKKDQELALQNLNKELALTKEVKFLTGLKNATGNIIPFSTISDEQKRILSGFMDLTKAQQTGFLNIQGNDLKNLQETLDLANSNISEIKYNTKRTNENISNALVETFGDKYNGKNYNEITKAAEALLNSPEGKSIASDVLPMFSKLKDRYNPSSPEEQEAWKVVANYYKHLNRQGATKKEKDLAAYIEAQVDRNQEMRYASDKFKESYNNLTGSTQYSATSVNPNPMYTQYRPEYDSQGNVTGRTLTGKANTVDGQIVNSIKTGSAKYPMEDLSGNKLEGNLVDFKMESTKDVRDNKNGTVTIYGTAIQQESYKDKDSEVTKYRNVPKQVKVTVSGTDYDDIKANEYESGFISEKSALSRGRLVGDKTYYELSPQASDPAKRSYFAYNKIVHQNTVQDLEKTKQEIKDKGKSATVNLLPGFQVQMKHVGETGGVDQYSYSWKDRNGAIQTSSSKSFEELQNELLEIKNGELIKNGR